MQRLRVRLILPADYGGGRTARIEAGVDQGGATARSFNVPRPIGAPETCWQRDGFLIGKWLGCVPPAGWLHQDWLYAWHLRPGWRLEAISWRMQFGRVYVRGVVLGPAGQEAVVAEQETLVNDSPAQARRLRPAGQDEQGRIGVTVR